MHCQLMEVCIPSFYQELMLFVFICTWGNQRSRELELAEVSQQLEEAKVCFYRLLECEAPSHLIIFYLSF
jgi:hypothetical protein